MAIDNTPPRIRLIATIATIVVITLIGLDFVFKSYFAFMTDEAKREKIAPKTALFAQIVVEHDAFAAAKIPLDQAMAQVAKGTRPELIEPKPSEDLGPMTGWSKLPKQPPLPAPSEAHVPGPGDLHIPGAADAGTPNAADGGATLDAGATKGPAAVKDAGVRAPGH